MSLHSMVYVGIYALIYLHTILGVGIVSRDGLPRGVLLSGILKIEKYCPGLEVRSPSTGTDIYKTLWVTDFYDIKLFEKFEFKMAGPKSILRPVYSQQLNDGRVCVQMVWFHQNKVELIFFTRFFQILYWFLTS